MLNFAFYITPNDIRRGIYFHPSVAISGRTLMGDFERRAHSDNIPPVNAIQNRNTGICNGANHGRHAASNLTSPPPTILSVNIAIPINRAMKPIASCRSTMCSSDCRPTAATRYPTNKTTGTKFGISNRRASLNIAHKSATGNGNTRMKIYASSNVIWSDSKRNIQHKFLLRMNC